MYIFTKISAGFKLRFMKVRLVFSLIFGLLISAVTLYFAFKNVSFHAVLKSLLQVNPFWILPTVIAVMINFILRTIRWKVILRSSQQVSFMGAYHPLIIGFMLNSILPARAGEIARPVILRKLEGTPFTTGLASVASERFFDILILVGFFAVMFRTIEIDPHLNIPFGKYVLNKSLLIYLGKGMIRLGILMICGMALIASKKIREIIAAVFLFLPGFFIRKNPTLKNTVEQKVCGPAIKIIDNFGDGFSVVKNPAEILKCIFLSISIWFFGGLSYYFLSLGFKGLSVTPVEMFIFMIIICFFIALPSVPGYWGLWEAGGVFALTLFGISANEAASFTLANHVIQFMPVIIAGIISMIITGVHLKQFAHPGKTEQPNGQ